MLHQKDAVHCFRQRDPPTFEGRTPAVSQTTPADSVRRAERVNVRLCVYIYIYTTGACRTLRATGTAKNFMTPSLHFLYHVLRKKKIACR